jgi:hypothetical protein
MSALPAFTVKNAETADSFSSDPAASSEAATGARVDAPICPTCDGIGDVVRADGEWLGYCDCKAGRERRGIDAEHDPHDALTPGVEEMKVGCCTRSHPHENMSDECERLTVISRNVSVAERARRHVQEAFRQNAPASSNDQGASQ